LAESPARSAAAAHLKYITDQTRGIRRVGGPKAFRYLDERGRQIRDTKVLERIRSLVIPPAWTDVWICPDERGHLQATGRDARGRKQHRYHPRWRELRDHTKYQRILDFAAALPRLRRRTAIDLARVGLPREKVLAAVVQLLERTLIRVGNDEYARDNHSFGLTTLRDGHAKISGGTVKFQFRGKSGKFHTVSFNDPRLARIVRECRDLPGEELFQYRDEKRQVVDIGSADVNAYLRDAMGRDFTAKDFRTWAGTVLAACALAKIGPCASQTQAKRNVLSAIDAVAGLLGNTRAICRKSYIHPEVLRGYADRSLGSALDALARTRRTVAPTALSEAETIVLQALTRSNRPHRKIA
jgi:DNA topoisomerase-1